MQVPKFYCEQLSHNYLKRDSLLHLNVSHL